MLVEAYGATDENGALSYLSTSSGSYQVKESVSEIDTMLVPLAAKSPIVGQYGTEVEKEWR